MPLAQVLAPLLQATTSGMSGVAQVRELEIYAQMIMPHGTHQTRIIIATSFPCHP